MRVTRFTLRIELMTKGCVPLWRAFVMVWVQLCTILLDAFSGVIQPSGQKIVYHLNDLAFGFHP
jgi:hypothetical protein